MENNNLITRTPERCTVVVHEDITEADNLESRVCPLCNSKVKLYQIHFNEKFLMCSNIDCEYPFGISDYHVYKIESKDELAGPEYSRHGSLTSGSTLSQNDWSELDKLLPAGSLFSPGYSSPQPFIEKSYDTRLHDIAKKSEENEAKIKQDVKKIKELNNILHELDNPLECVNNTKWLLTMAEMQERSGVQLLKEKEMAKVKSSKPHIGSGELKIDIDSTKNVISVQIEAK